MRPYSESQFDKGGTMQYAALDHDDSSDQHSSDQPDVAPDSADDYDFKVLLIIALVTVPFLILAGFVVVFL